MKTNALDRIVASGLTLMEGDFQVTGLTVTVRAGEIVGLVGRQGSGKSKCLDLITGRVAPTFGVLKICGMNIGGIPPSSLVGTNLTLPSATETISGECWLKRLANQAGLSSGTAVARTGRLISLLELSDSAGLPLDQWGTEERSLLALAGSIIAKPSIVVADEPLKGLTDGRAKTVWQFFRYLSAAGTAILISINPVDLHHADCDRIYLLEQGMIVARGTAEELYGVQVRAMELDALQRGGDGRR